MRLIKWLVGTVLVLLVLVGVAPLLSKWALQHWLESRGYEVRIKKLGIDFIFGEISVGGVQLRSAQGEQLQLLEGFVRLDLSSLIVQPVKVSMLRVDHLKLDLDRRDGKLYAAGFNLSGLNQWLDEGWSAELASVQFKDTDICRFNRHQCLRLGQVNSSRVNLRSGPSWQLSHQGALRVEKIFLQDATGDSALVFTDLLQISSAIWARDSAVLTDVQVSNFQFIEAAAASQAKSSHLQTQLGEMHLSSASWAVGDLSKIAFGDVKIISLRQVIQNLEQSTLDDLVDSIAFWQPQIPQLLIEYRKGSSVAATINSFDVRDGVLNWIDTRVNPPVHLAVSGVRLQTSALNTRQPLQTTAIKLKGALGETGSVELEGEIALFAEASNFHLDGSVLNANFANFSAYTAQWLRQTVHSGDLDLGFQLAAEQGIVRGSSQWRLSDLQVAPELRAAGRMPLARSLGLLQDSQRGVSFTLAIDGNLHDGVLSASNIWSSIASKLSFMATSKINPAGAVAIEPRAGGQTPMSFRPLLYQTNAHLPADLDRERIDNIVQLLKGKPQLSMVFCPVSTGAEWAEMFNNGIAPDSTTSIPQEQRSLLMELAQARGAALRKILLQEGLDDHQIVICKPSFELDLRGPSYISVAL